MLELPEKLEERVLPCETGTFMRTYEMTPTDYHLVPVHLLYFSHTRIDYTAFQYNTLANMMRDVTMSKIQDQMTTLNLIAVTDLKINRLLREESYEFVEIFGTGIQPKAKMPKQDGETK